MKNFIYNLISILELIGRKSIKLFNNIVLFKNFTFTAIKGIFTSPHNFTIICQQIINIGFYSLPVVGITAIFSGAVLALQTYEGFSRFSAEHSIPMVVVISITRELGPVSVGLMVAGRIGASIAAEIGTMRVTEQIDALFVLSTDPIKYLATPRLIAAALTLPFLVFISDIIGVVGGYLVSIYKLEFNSYQYINNTFKYLKAIDITSGLTKALVFGCIISLISCFYGYHTGKGAKGVGKATTYAVVSSSVSILLSNYIITVLFFSK